MGRGEIKKEKKHFPLPHYSAQTRRGVQLILPRWRRLRTAQASSRGTLRAALCRRPLQRFMQLLFFIIFLLLLLLLSSSSSKDVSINLQRAASSGCRPASHKDQKAFFWFVSLLLFPTKPPFQPIATNPHFTRRRRRFFFSFRSVTWSQTLYLI